VSDHKAYCAKYSKFEPTVNTMTKEQQEHFKGQIDRAHVTKLEACLLIHTVYLRFSAISVAHARGATGM